ncbi:hypothetical protein M409DRAFT_22349 [Zasmidium cellare ATCC 36951]|uniref:F-box domain-containing protein n=1 Tax=Zasmidium cellare ATCC 36951 TaxID=1080233 RepID=A0A6A6CLM7_ZASCE|nr:uncharacterized protein M409DRAFT_22349 [Zasmidium cellare ATCC 36951]KAF2167543.1 hypothetical protein M409DRAFT_22349 [Zasmidium cellare ATCC 36951]
MADEDMAKLSLHDEDEKKMPHLPNEILTKIFSHHQFPSASTIGRDRYEGLNIPKGPLVRTGPIEDYIDNDLNTGASIHKHGEYKEKLRTLSAISNASRTFHKVALPLMYAIYPGQTVVKPKLFLRSIKKNPELAPLVKQMVIDPWDTFNGSKQVRDSIERVGLQKELPSILDRQAEEWNDEAYATLLLLRCPDIDALTITLPSFYSADVGLFDLLKKIRQADCDSRTKKNGNVGKPENVLVDMPLRKGAHALMRLSSVESVTAYRFWDGATTLKGLQHLQSLTLWRNSFKPAELLKALDTCTGLRSLNIMFAGFKSILGKLLPDDRIDMNELGKIIRMKLTNLRDLRLDDREQDPPKPYVLPSLRRGPPLEKLAINEAALGCYTGRRMPSIPLADMLPKSLQSLAILRSNQWWHEADHGPRGNEFIGDDGVTYRFDAIHDKIVEFLRSRHEKCPELKEIYLDTPAKFGRSVKAFGWKIERVVEAEVLERPSVVVDMLVPPKEKREWEKTQVERGRLRFC